MKRLTLHGTYHLGIMKLLTAICFIFLVSYDISAQQPEHPPRPITVTVSLVQKLNFGTFARNLGGELEVYTDDSRNVNSGDIILLGMGNPSSAALFIVEGNPGTVVSIQAGPDVDLGGSNGGKVTLKIGSTDPPSPFILSGSINYVSIGGILIVGDKSQSPDGIYNGQFSVNFIQE